MGEGRSRGKRGIKPLIERAAHFFETQLPVWLQYPLAFTSVATLLPSPQPPYTTPLPVECTLKVIIVEFAMRRPPIK